MTRLYRLFLVIVALVGALPAAAQCPLTAGAGRTVVPGPRLAAAAVHVPAAVADGAPLPLVLLLHGSTGTGAALLRQSGLAAVADRRGFLLAYPDGGIPAGDGFVWNIPGVPTVTDALPPRGARDDVAYLGALVDRLVAIGCVDPARVYATGLSGGGRMASWLGCVAARRFAAIAPVVGLRAGRPLAAAPDRPDPASCRPARPVAVMTFAGGRDDTNPIAGGGAAYWRYGMAAALARWAAIDGCTTAPTTRWIAPGVYEQRYAGCRDGTEVAARVTDDAGHSWVADNDALWAFLSRHRRTD